MTIQELIDFLASFEDKSKEVTVHDGDGDFYLLTEVDGALFLDDDEMKITRFKTSATFANYFQRQKGE